jgi:hypothetical protein
VTAAGLGWLIAALTREVRQDAMPPQIKVVAFSMACTLTLLGPSPRAGWTTDLTFITVLLVLQWGALRFLRLALRRRDADPSDRGPLWDAEIDGT